MSSITLSEIASIEVTVTCAFDNCFDLMCHYYFKENKSSLSTR